MLRELLRTIVVGGCALTVVGADTLSAQVKPDLIADFSVDARTGPAKQRYLSLSNVSRTDTTTITVNRTYFLSGEIRNNGLAAGGRGAQCRWVLARNADGTSVIRTLLRFAIVSDIPASGGVITTPGFAFRRSTRDPSEARCFVVLLVDTLNTVNEVDESNNTFGRTVRCPGVVDLVCSSSRISSRRFSAGGALRVTVRTRNLGGDPTAVATTTLVVLSSDSNITTSDTPLGSVVVPAGLRGGATHTRTISVTIPRTVPDNVTCYIGCIADSRRRQRELSESNNTLAMRGTCFREVDYIISAFQVNPRGFGNQIVRDTCGRQLFDATVTTKNLGRGTGGTTFTLILVSNDATLSNDDTVLQKLDIPVLGPVGQRTRNFSFALPACFRSSGACYFFAVADAGLEEPELDETNNVWAPPVSSPCRNVLLPRRQAAVLEYKVTKSDPFLKVSRDRACLEYDLSAGRATPAKVRMCLTSRNSRRFYLMLWSRTATPFTFDAFSGFSLGALQAPFFINWLGFVDGNRQAMPEFDFNMVGAGLTGPVVRTLRLYVHAAVFTSSMRFEGWANNGKSGLLMKFDTVN